MKDLIFKTAWPMAEPAPYSPFHLIVSTAGILAACLLACRFRRIGEKRFLAALTGCGLLLAAGEVYKQLFLYYVVGRGTYDWWYFPFQLCSLPMYFCLILPLLPWPRLRLAVLTFMQDFNLLGGVMALAEPSGLMHPYWTLTVHGLMWHILLIFIGLLIGFGGRSDGSLKGFIRTLPLFGACCLLASFINVATHTLGNADMFYISPYYPTTQLVFHEIALKLGIMAGNVIYLLSICAGGLVCHLLMRRIQRVRINRTTDHIPR